MPVPRVLAVGDVNIDLVFTGLAHIPLVEQETLAQGFEVLVGGQTGTLARALARLGLQVTFVGRVGNDEYGRRAANELARAGVDTSGLVIDPLLPTGVTVVLSAGRERAYATYLGSLAALQPCDITPRLLERADHMHLGSFYLQRALRPHMLELFQAAKARGLTISIDPGWDVFEEWDNDILDVLHYVDVFLPNEVEALRITGEGSLEQALATLAARAGTVVIKLGQRGCLARHNAETCACPAFQVPVVDVTSAGDVSNAGFLYGFLSRWPIAEALRFANACAALSVSRPGSAGIMSNIAEVHAFLAAHPGE